MRISISAFFLVISGILVVSYQAPALVLDAAPQVIATWPSDPLTVRVALDRPLDSALLDWLAKTEIPFRTGTGATEPTGTLRVAGARLEDDSQTLVLLTDPHPTEATYTLSIPGLDAPITYDLSGVEAQWVAKGGDDAQPGWAGWLPELDLARAREQTFGSTEHDRAFARFARPGKLTLRTLLDLPEGETIVDLVASAPFEPELAFEPAESIPGPGGNHRASFTIDAFGEAVELYLTLPTGGDRPVNLQVSTRPAEAPESKAEPLPKRLQVLPWAPPPSTPTDAPAELPADMLNGDPERGEAVYFGETGKCSTCHKINGQGEEIGPDLSAIASKYDAAGIYREIESPSSVIHPDYLPYTIATVDGRVAVGIVRAEGADAIRVVDAEARETTLLRSEIEEIQPGTTSIMPVGLVGAIGTEGMRDLMAYLLQLRED